ncbi:MAG: exodeoxyribonuclease VII large subunit, partial [Ruminococcus sp.]
SAAAELAVPSIEELAQAVKRETRLLKQVFEKNTEQLENRLQRLTEHLIALSPEQRQKSASRDLEVLSEKLDKLMKSKIQQCENSLQKELVRLDALSPLKILKRGYALVYKDSSILRSAVDADAGDELYIKLGSGQIHVKVLDRKEDTDEF